MSTHKPYDSSPAHFVREPEYDKAIQEIAANYARLDDMEQAIEWALTRAPKRFYNISDDFYLWRTDEALPDFPALRIIYRYSESEHTVYMLRVSVVRDGENEGPEVWGPFDPDKIDF